MHIIRTPRQTEGWWGLRVDQPSEGRKYSAPPWPVATQGTPVSARCRSFSLRRTYIRTNVPMVLCLSTFPSLLFFIIFFLAFFYLCSIDFIEQTLILFYVFYSYSFLNSILLEVESIFYIILSICCTCTVVCWVYGNDGVIVDENVRRECTNNSNFH